MVPETLQIVGDYLHNEWKYDHIAVIAGPSHAEEIALEKLSYLTIACQDSKKAEFIASLLKTKYVRTKISNDIFGTVCRHAEKHLCHCIAHGNKESNYF